MKDFLINAIPIWLLFVLAVGSLFLINKSRDTSTNSVRSVAAVSFDHDGHRWVRGLYGGGIAHHPDCPCHAQAERGAE